jgi:hypothetical protein
MDRQRLANLVGNGHAAIKGSQRVLEDQLHLGPQPAPFGGPGLRKWLALP